MVAPGTPSRKARSRKGLQRWTSVRIRLRIAPKTAPHKRFRSRCMVRVEPNPPVPA
jgi:hypothetical protein